MNSEWTTKLLGDVIELKRGFDLPQSQRRPGAVPIVSSSGISGRHAEFRVRGPGVVTGRYGTIGQVFYVEEDFWPLNTTLYAKDFKGHSPRFVYHLLGTVQFLDYSDKAAVPGINRNHLHQAKIVLPAPEIEDRFAQLVEPYWMRHSANNREAVTLAVLRDAMLPKLLSGEVKVPDHEPVE